MLRGFLPIPAALLLVASTATAVSAFEREPSSGWPMYQYSATHNAVFIGDRPGVTWSFEAGDKINGGLAAVAGTVFFGSFDHKVYALDAETGRERWAADAGAIVMSTPAVWNNVVIV